jgi:hypothetical protein
MEVLTRDRHKCCPRQSAIRPNQEQSDEHAKLCVLALQLQRAAEIRCQLPWARIAHALGTLKAVRYRCESRTIVQRTKVAAELSAMLKTLGISVPKQILAVEEAPQAVAAA